VRIKKIKKKKEGSYEVVEKKREGEEDVRMKVKVRYGEKENKKILEKLKSVKVEEGENVVMSKRVVGKKNKKVKWIKKGKKVKEKKKKREGDK
jgi:hypothetical protein